MLEPRRGQGAELGSGGPGQWRGCEVKVPLSCHVDASLNARLAAQQPQGLDPGPPRSGAPSFLPSAPGSCVA